MNSFREQLNVARKELLNLTLRNPLLNYRLKKASGLQISNERSSDLFNIIIENAKTMHFLPQKNIEEIKMDDADFIDEIELSYNYNKEAGYTDNKLQTAHGEKELFKRLFRTYNNALTYIEERGINTLFLALGMLKWYEDKNSNIEHYAPLVLVPVILKRSSIMDRFSLSYSDDDIAFNFCLQEKISADFRCIL